jgi:hypothetical protein
MRFANRAQAVRDYNRRAARDQVVLVSKSFRRRVDSRIIQFQIEFSGFFFAGD